MAWIERVDYNKVISVKLVIPSGCNANCNFCYMKDYQDCITTDKASFLNNFIQSLDKLIVAVEGKNPISLDITGNEPTFDVELLRDVMGRLREYNIKDKVQRVTITTNGYHLFDVVSYISGVVDYVNISIHDYDRDRRSNILNCKECPTDQYYKNCIELLNDIGITVSCVSVIHKHIPNFKMWLKEFIEWCINIGFIAIRLRCDVFWNEGNVFDEYMIGCLADESYQVITHEHTADSHWCRLKLKNGFRVFFLHGVKDTSVLTKGIEYIISNDGKCYCDFYRKTTLDEYQYEVGKIYDKS